MLKIKMIPAILFINTLVLLTSCGDCIQRVSGVVLDANTKISVGEVVILKKEKTTKNTLSNKDGIFILEDISGGFKCPAMTLLFVKKGYDTLEVDIPSGDSMTVSLHALPAQ